MALHNQGAGLALDPRAAVDEELGGHDSIPAVRCRDVFTRCYGAYAKVVHAHYILVLCLAFAVALVLSLGILKIRTQNDPEKLWLPDNDFTLHAKRVHDKMYGNALEELVDITAKDVKHDVVTTDMLLQVWELDAMLRNITVTVHGAQYRFEDICVPGGTPCLAFSILQFWGYSREAIASDPNPHLTISYFNPALPLSMVLGGYITRPGDPGAGEPPVVVTFGSAYKQWYYLDDSAARHQTTPHWHEVLMAWESAFLRATRKPCTRASSSSSCSDLRVYRKASRSSGDVMTHEQVGDHVALTPLAVATSFKFATDLFSTRSANSRFVVGLFGIISNSAAISMALGLLGWANVVMVPSGAAMYFFILALGLYHMKTFVHAVENADRRVRSRRLSSVVEDRHGQGVGIRASPSPNVTDFIGGDASPANADNEDDRSSDSSMGNVDVDQASVFVSAVQFMCPSLLVSTVAAIVGLIALSLVPDMLPGLRNLCYMTAIAWACEHFMFMTAWLSMIAWDLRRIEAGYRDFPVCQHSGGVAGPRVTQRLLKTFYGVTLSRRPVRLLMVLLVLGAAAYASYRSSSLHSDEQEWAVYSPKSYLHKFLTTDYKYFGALGVPIDIIVEHPLNYSAIEVGRHMRNLSRTILSSPYVEPVPSPSDLSWYDAFLDYVNATHERHKEPLIDGIYPRPEAFVKPFLADWCAPAGPGVQFCGADLIPAPAAVMASTRLQGYTTSLLHRHQQISAVVSLQHAVSRAMESDFPSRVSVFAPPFPVFRTFYLLQKFTLISFIVAAITLAVVTLVLLRCHAGFTAGLGSAFVCVELIGYYLQPTGRPLDDAVLGILLVLPYFAFDMMLSISSHTHTTCSKVVRAPVAPSPVGYEPVPDMPMPKEFDVQPLDAVSSRRRQLKFVVALSAQTGSAVLSTGVGFAVISSIATVLMVSPVNILFAKLFALAWAFVIANALLFIPACALMLSCAKAFSA